jgi:hypothetical protein
MAGAPPDGDPLLTQARTFAGPFAIDEVQLPGDLKASQYPLNRMVGASVTEGRVAGVRDGVSGGATRGEVTMVAQPDLPRYWIARYGADRQHRMPRQTNTLCRTHRTLSRERADD